MAKSTYLQLCQVAAKECGLSNAVNLSAVTGKTGVMDLVIKWVAQADLETQSRWFDWDFLHVDSWSTATVIGTAAVAAPSDIGVWDQEAFYLNYTLATHKHLSVMPYKTWRRDYRQGVKTNAKPSHVVIHPNLSLTLESPPDAVYTLTGEYWSRPAKMTVDASESPVPEEYERIIVARAKMYYAEYEAAPEIMGSASVEYDDLLDKLEAKYLTNQIGRRMSDPGMMVVRPE